MNPNVDDWDDDLPPEPEEVYQDLVRALKRKSGFGLFFVQCAPVGAENLIAKLPQEIPQKHIEVLRLVKPIDNLYQRVVEFVKDKQVDILLINGLDNSLSKYEQGTFGEITRDKFSDLTSVPHILNHLNQQRERFRDDFPFCFVFLLLPFSINYLIHRAPDFFDWRSGVFILPTKPELVEQQSNRLLFSANYEEYLKLSQEQKDDYQAWNNKGIALSDLGRKQDAIVAYEQAIKIKPDYYQAWNNKGITLSDLGRKQEAIAAYEQAIKIKPDLHQAWNNKGNVLSDLGRKQEAIAAYEQAINIKPDYHEAWNNKGNALSDLGRKQEAIAAYEQAINIKPDYHEAWNNKGNVLSDLGRKQEAIAAYEQAINIKPDYHKAWNNKGYTLLKLGCYEDAISSYDKALLIQPKDTNAWYNKACCHALQGNIEQALENLQQAINLNPDEYIEMTKSDSDFDSIRDDERFQELIQGFVNKFPKLNREANKVMLSMELIKGTRVYKKLKEEVKQEVKTEMIAKLLQRGMSVQEVAEILELDVEVIRNVTGK